MCLNSEACVPQKQTSRKSAVETLDKKYTRSEKNTLYISFMLSKPNPASKNRNVQPLLSRRISRVFAGDSQNTLMVGLTWRGLWDPGESGSQGGRRYRKG